MQGTVVGRPKIKRGGDVAQLVERLLCKQDVRSSSLLISIVFARLAIRASLAFRVDCAHDRLTLARLDNDTQSVMKVRARRFLVLASFALAGCAGAVQPGLAPAGRSPGGSVSGNVEATRLLAPNGTTAALVVHSSQVGAAISNKILGANLAIWYDVTQSGIGSSLHDAEFTALRWPGGSDSDLYHWATHTLCQNGYDDPHDTFDNFMQQVALPAKLDVAVTADYGSNPACNAGGDPAEAAAWVDYANNTKGYHVETWTVGNEEYGSWEYDLHSNPHDATTYAQAVATGYYPDIKAKDPSAQVGVVVEPGWSPAWDPIVLSQASYDFVEMHFYAQTPGKETDAYLLTQAPQALTAQIAALQAELVTAGKPATPIYMGELGSVYSNPGKQTSSITQALFAGMVLGEMMNDGVARATWWLGYGGCSDPSNGNFSKSLYGWQNFGGYMIFSDGIPEYGCSNATPVKRGTRLPTVRAFQLMAAVAKSGEHVLGSTLGGSSGNVRAYAMTHGSGYGLALFNLDESHAATIAVSIDSLSQGSSVVTTTYDRAIYDKSKNNVWAGPVTHRSGAWQKSFTVTLPAWSMNVVVVSP